MKEEQKTSKSTDDETTPDVLMESFHGRSLKSIVVFTLIIHAIILLGTSIPFLIEKVAGKDTSEMSEDERIQLAVKEATSSLRDIADEHGLNVQDISNQFASGAKKPKAPATKPVADPKSDTESEKPKSAIEKEIDVKVDGPEVPKVEEDDDDLFK
jgi:NhaP-type Na+/H+ or K+/H+ antiporter